jgi:hypothetical protein
MSNALGQLVVMALLAGRRTAEQPAEAVPVVH